MIWEVFSEENVFAKALGKNIASDEFLKCNCNENQSPGNKSEYVDASNILWYLV